MGMRRPGPDELAIRAVLGAATAAVVGWTTPLPLEGTTGLVVRVIGVVALMAVVVAWAGVSGADRLRDLSFRIGLAALAGPILAILSAPVNLAWLHWFGLLPMFWVVTPGTFRRNALLGWLFGTVGVGAIFFWIATTIPHYSDVPVPAAMAITGLFAAVFGLQYVVLWPTVHPLRQRLGIWWILAFPAVQVLIELISLRLFLFPYFHGVSQYRVATTWQLASVTGIWGLTYLLFLSNAVLAESLYRYREGRRLPVRALCGVAITVSCVVMFGGWRYAAVEAQLADAPRIRVVQIQSDTTMIERMNAFPCQTWADWWEPASELTPGTADLMIWPEGASPYPLNLERKKAVRYEDSPCEERPRPARELAALARDKQVDLIVGAGSREPIDRADGRRGYEAYNSVYYFPSDGSEPHRYDKVVPLPFGEYIPFGDAFPWLRELIHGVGNFRAGTEYTVFQTGHGGVATPICYEAILPSVCNTYPSPDLLVNVTNDAWFLDSPATHQHAMLASVRAIELGIPEFRSAYTGVSMVFEPHGRILYETPTFERVNRIVQVRSRRVFTVYGALARYRLADWFAWLCALGLVVTLLVLPWIRRRVG